MKICGTCELHGLPDLIAKTREDALLFLRAHHASDAKALLQQLAALHECRGETETSRALYRQLPAD